MNRSDHSEQYISLHPAPNQFTTLPSSEIKQPPSPHSAGHRDASSGYMRLCRALVSDVSVVEYRRRWPGVCFVAGKAWFNQIIANFKWSTLLPLPIDAKLLSTHVRGSNITWYLGKTCSRVLFDALGVQSRCLQIEECSLFLKKNTNRHNITQQELYMFSCLLCSRYRLSCGLLPPCQAPCPPWTSLL